MSDPCLPYRPTTGAAGCASGGSRGNGRQRRAPEIFVQRDGTELVFGPPPRSGGGPQSPRSGLSLQHVRSAVRGRDPTTRPRRPLGRYLCLHDGTSNVRRRRRWPQDPLPPTHDRRGHSRRSTR
jgi:hypothetical protein